MKAFAMKHEQRYSDYNHGKSGKQRKRNKRLGKKAGEEPLETIRWQFPVEVARPKGHAQFRPAYSGKAGI